MANSILTPEESTNLYDMLQQFSSIHYGSTAHFKKSVRKRADLLVKSHREAIENNDGSAADQTFIEHYFLLQKMARESLKNLNRKDLPVKTGFRMFTCLLKLC